MYLKHMAYIYIAIFRALQVVCVCVCVCVSVCVCVHIPKHMAYIYVAIFRALQVARGQARQAEVGPYPGLGRQAI